MSSINITIKQLNIRLKKSIYAKRYVLIRRTGLI